MKSFIYKARDTSGKLISGVLQAESRDDLIRVLKERKVLPISVDEATVKQFLGGIRKRIKLSDINVFSRQIAALLRAGVPLLDGLKAIEEQSENPTFKNIMVGVIADIEGGEFFSEALGKHERVFGNIYVNMVKAAEAGGMLDDTLDKLAIIGEAEESLRSEVRSATSYPVLVFGALILAFFILSIAVLPRFAKIFARFGSNLPLPTRVMIGLTNFMHNYWYLAVIGIVGIAAGLKFLVNTIKGRLFWDRLVLKLPVFGPLVMKVIFSRFVRILSTLTKSGVPLVKVLELAKDASGNVIISLAISNISDKIVQGQSMSSAMKESGFFPPLVVQMVSAGEGTGRLDELLVFVSEYYDAQVKYALKNLITYIEPALILVISSSVLFIALAVFLPMWDMTKLFTKGAGG